MTFPYEAYCRGRWQRRSVGATWISWEDHLPYACQPLVDAWITGWRDEVADYSWWPFGKEEPAPIPIGVEKGRCPWCWNYPLRARPRDGKLWCLQYPCRNLTGKPDGRIFEEGETP